MIDDPRLRLHPLGFYQLVDPPSNDELKAYYRDKYFQQNRGSYQKTYSEDERAWIDAKLAQQSQVVAQIRGAGPGRFLDVGCGEGFAMSWFKRNGWAVEGIDHSTAGLKALHPELCDTMDCGDVFELLEQRIVSGARYQLVWLSNVLEHVPAPVELLQSLCELVADDGVLVVTVPNDGSALQELSLANGNIPDRFWIAAPDHISYFSRASLERTAGATGWRCREILADFPIDLFLLHPASNYVRDGDQGPAAHRARVCAELLLVDRDQTEVNSFYSAMARIGLGRNLTAFLTREAM